MIKFSVALLEKEPIELEGEEPLEFLDVPDNGQYTVVSPMRYELVARYVSGNALVTGRCSVGIRGECGRCLDNVSRDVVAEIDGLCYDLDKAPDEIDISEDIRTEMVLALPLNLLCSDECEGVCPVCGANRNRRKCSCRGTEMEPQGSLAWSVLDGIDFGNGKGGGKCSK